jgi:hypothetical protein
MTPFAHQIVRQYLRRGLFREPLKASPGSFAAAVLCATECHCFETSQISELATELLHNLNWTPCDDPHVQFLPSPVTWLEQKYDDGRHQGFLLFSLNLFPKLFGQNHGFSTGALWFADNDNDLEACPDFVLLGVNAIGGLMTGSVHLFEHESPCQQKMDREIVATAIWVRLAIINSPHIIGQRPHSPHAGLQREIASTKGRAGKYPLHDWTEVLLEVTPPPISEGAHANDTEKLIGQRALHFCRSHLRVRLGKLERVSAHWRGNPEIGIKHATYKVVP